MSIILNEVKRIEHSNSGSSNTECKEGMRDFMNLPRKIYHGNTFWVEPLSFDESKVFNPKSPFWEHAEMACYVAYQGNEPVGRIAAIYDHRFNQFHNGKKNEPGLNGKTGFFGFYESGNDFAISSALVAKVEETLKSWGAKSILEPLDPSLNRRSGLLVNGIEKDHRFNGFEGQPRIMMPYNPIYYQELLERDGFEKAKDLLAFKIESSDISNCTERMSKLVDRLTREKAKDGNPKIRARHLSRLTNPCIVRDIGILGDLYNSSWTENWGFTPLTERESREFGIELAVFGGHNWTYITEVYDEEKGKYQPAGFMGVLPDYNIAFKDQKGRINLNTAVNFLRTRAKPKYIRIALLGIKPEFRGRGLDALLYNQVFKAGHKFGIIEGEQSWMLEDNLPMLNPLIKSLGAKHYRTYRLYQKPISD